jgi:hypothetical protein
MPIRVVFRYPLCSNFQNILKFNHIQTMIHWFYIFSPKYEVFHHILSNSLIDCSGFEAHPCFFEQSAFERKTKEDEHFFAGNALKFRMLLHELESLEEGAPFVISDADVYIANASKFYSICLSELEKRDLTGMAERYNDMKSINIGILLCKNTKTIRDFFTFLANTIESTGGQDQAILNDCVGDWPLSVGLFPVPDVIQSNMYDITKSNEFTAIQFLCSSKNSNNNIFEKLLSACFFLDLTDLLYLLPTFIVEPLIDFYKQRYPENPICQYKLV